MVKTSRRIKELADEMLVHGTHEALAVLSHRYSAEEILKAAEIAEKKRGR